MYVVCIYAYEHMYMNICIYVYVYKCMYINVSKQHGILTFLYNYIHVCMLMYQNCREFAGGAASHGPLLASPGLSWASPEPFLGFSWASPGILAGLSWGSPGPLLGFSWASPGPLLASPGLSWASSGRSWAYPGLFLTSLVLSWPLLASRVLS
jgi:hypothetical protein